MSKRKEKSFAEFVEYWKSKGYEVHVTNEFLEDLGNLESDESEFSFWELLAFPFELAEDLLTYLPRNKLTAWLSSWTATLAIMANRPVYTKLMERKKKPQKTYRIA